MLFEHILHDVAAKVSYVGKVIHRRTAGVHLHLAGLVRYELLNRM